MHWVRKMKHYARESLLAVVCLVGPGLALAVDTYNSVTDQLTIAELHYGN